MEIMRRQTLNTATQLFDLLLMTLSFGAATLPVMGSGEPFTQFLSMKIKLQNFVLFFCLLYIWHLIFKTAGLYGSKRLASRKTEAIDIVKATGLGTTALVVAAFLLRFRMVTPAFAAAFWMLSTILMVSTRAAIRSWLRRLRKHGRNLRNMLIVGSNDRAIRFGQAIERRPELGYRIIGFADQRWKGAEELEKHGYSLVSDLETLPTFLRHTVVDEVVLALPIRSFHLNSSDLAVLCEQQGIILRVLSDLFNLKTARSRAEEIEGATLITHYVGSSGGGTLLIKRIVDCALSLALMILVGPVLLLTAILVKLTSPGPVFFVQERIGYNKRPFHIYKFRTMVVNAEEMLCDVEHLNEVSGPVFKIRNDPRITPIGKFLRRTSIDELPQLFNVLAGDMSLVGPRPLQVRDYDLFTKDCEDWQRCRFSVRPGITCLWQIKGRSAMPFEKWMELDLQYVHEWSLRLDFEILARTIPAVLKRSGAA
jgi:exopolysaccharide biosynthesis polyprenyl glycosylphosphotransferase